MLLFEFFLLIIDVIGVSICAYLLLMIIIHILHINGCFGHSKYLWFRHSSYVLNDEPIPPLYSSPGVEPPEYSVICIQKL
jgi:hypothetical protein